jgi:threonyl-tRNA synthetase
MSKNFGDKKATDMSDIEMMRHSLAHIFAGVVMEMYPNTKLAIGPSVDNGFYYDVESDHVFSPDDFKEIEKKMRKVVNKDIPFEGKDVSKEDAIKYFEEKNQPYKVEILNELEDGNITFYSHGDFTDLCKGGHTDSTGQVGAFKIHKVAGAYWRGDERNQMLQRIYGLAFNTKEELKEYLLMLEQAKKRDHRKLGKELDLFAFSELVGPGLPLFTPRGNIIREQLQEFVWELMKPHGYEKVTIPHMAKADLYKTSGHYEKFTDDIFHIKSKMTDDAFIMKPMNCPHHTQIYASRPRSYRDLPIRYSEVTAVYRDENTGQLQGLSRVRSITQDDAHVFCTVEQIKDECNKIHDIIDKFYKPFNMPLKARLSRRDSATPEKYLGEPELWDQAEGLLKDLLEEMEYEWIDGPGEAAFYGPKIDFIATDAIGREWQLATIQLDFVQPARFQLKYAGQDGEEKQPVMIHRAVLGSVERFMAVMIEHFGGSFPAWLAPEQVRLLAVSEQHNDFVLELKQKLQEQDVRVQVDISDNTVSKKIRESEKMKIPYALVIGDQEKESGKVAIRKRGIEGTVEMEVQEFIDYVLEKQRSRDSSY